MNLPVYLDYNATTPIAAEVAEAIEPYLREHFGNPSSGHVYGERSRNAVNLARSQVAQLIGAQANDIVFTGCATEGNNLALLGVARALRDTGRHIITSAVEHPAVAQPCRRLEEDGWQVTVLPVDEYGRISVEDLAAALREDTVLVSIMHSNNETGTLQAIEDIATLTRERGVLLHSDAAQSIGKVPVDVDALGVDLLTLAGHKFYASKGVGALYIRPGTPIAPLIVGAGHEHGLRPGTENVPALAGFGKAAELVHTNARQYHQHLLARREQLHQLLNTAIPGLLLNGHPQHRLPNTLNISFPGCDGRHLLQQAENDVAASVGSACHEEGGVSGVLGAMGIDTERARGAVRLSVGVPTSEADIQRAANALIGAWRQQKP